MTSVAPRPRRCSARRSCLANGPSARDANSRGLWTAAPTSRGPTRWPRWRALAPTVASRMRDAAAGVVLTRAQSPRDWVMQWRVAAVARGMARCRPACGRLVRSPTGVRWLARGLRAPRPRRSAAAAARGARRAARCRVEHHLPAARSCGVDRDRGFLEAASVTFDALWIAGCRRNNGRRLRARIRCCLSPGSESGACRGRARHGSSSYARGLTERLARCSPIVVVSAPAVLADYPTRPSALVEGEWPAMTRPLPDDSVTRIAAAKSMESVRDERAPPLHRERLPAGQAPSLPRAIVPSRRWRSIASASSRGPTRRRDLSAERARSARARDDGDLLDGAARRTTRSSRSMRKRCASASTRRHGRRCDRSRRHGGTPAARHRLRGGAATAGNRGRSGSRPSNGRGRRSR